MEWSPSSFKPSPRMKKLYYTYLLIPAILVILFLVLPLSYFVGFYYFQLWIYVPLLLLFAACIVWIQKYYTSISYSLGETHLIVQEGVLFKFKSRIPFKQITNTMLHHGPITRMYGLASIGIQTAGRSGEAGSEASLKALESYEEIDEEISRRVEAAKAERVEPKTRRKPETTQADILHELQAIKEILQDIAESPN